MYSDGDALCICFTDDRRDEPFPNGYLKMAAKKRLNRWLQLKQEGDFEFIGRLMSTAENVIKVALEVLEVTSNQPLTMPEKWTLSPDEGMPPNRPPSRPTKTNQVSEPKQSGTA
jgi:hypothetical protein